MTAPNGTLVAFKANAPQPFLTRPSPMSGSEISTSSIVYGAFWG